MQGILDGETAHLVAIRELVDRYHAAVNLRDFALLEALFTHDAVWEAGPPVNLRFDRRDAIMEGLRGTIGRQELLIQGSSGVAIELSGPDAATVRSTMSEFGREVATGAGWRAVAFYLDRVVRDQDGEWRFRQRSLRVRYMEDVAVDGTVFALPA